MEKNKKMTNYIVTLELRHLASGDYDEQDFHSDCGSKREHLKRNSCPKKHGVIGDCHYELYVQQEVVVKADSEEEAREIAGDRFTLDKLLDDYLLTKGVTEFDSSDFEGSVDEFYISETDEPEGVSEMIIMHEKLYYDNE